MSDTVLGKAANAVHDLDARIEREETAYRQGEDRPVRPFVAIMAAYGGLVGIGTVAARRKGLPAAVGVGDLALVSVATHKLSRLLAKDPVTSPLRAPFTTFEGTSVEAELQEEVRGSGTRKAMGELVTCPFCLGQWVATGFVFGLVFAPRAHPAGGVDVHRPHRGRPPATRIRRR